ALVDFDVENGPCQDQTEFLYEVYLRRVELPESGKLQNTINFLIRDKRYDKNTRGPLVAENPGRNGHILFRNLGAKDSIFFCNGLSYQALGKLEPLLQILFPAIRKACAEVDRDRVVFFIYYIECALYRVDLFKDKLDDVFSERVKCVVKPQDFADLSNTPYDPVAFLVAALVFHKVLSHVAQRHSQHVVVGYGFEFRVVFSFTDALRKLSIVFQCLHEVVNL